MVITICEFNKTINFFNVQIVVILLANKHTNPYPSKNHENKTKSLYIILVTDNYIVSNIFRILTRVFQYTQYINILHYKPYAHQKNYHIFILFNQMRLVNICGYKNHKSTWYFVIRMEPFSHYAMFSPNIKTDIFILFPFHICSAEVCYW